MAQLPYTLFTVLPESTKRQSSCIGFPSGSCAIYCAAGTFYSTIFKFEVTPENECAFSCRIAREYCLALESPIYHSKFPQFHHQVALSKQGVPSYSCVARSQSNFGHAADAPKASAIGVSMVRSEFNENETMVS